MSSNKNTNTSADYDAVVATVQGYVEGLKTGEIAQLKKTFHENAIMYGFSPDGLLEGSINNLYTFVEQYGTAPNIATHLDVLDITPTTAVVRVTMENDAAGCDYTDYHSLIKIDGTWKVIAKLFHLYDK